MRVGRLGEILHELALQVGVLLGQLRLNCVELCQRLLMLLSLGLGFSV